MKHEVFYGSVEQVSPLATYSNKAITEVSIVTEELGQGFILYVYSHCSVAMTWKV